MDNNQPLNPPMPGQVNETFYLTEDIPLEDRIASCQKIRRRYYPPITDYIDGVVKGDQAQVDAYIQACQQIKNRFPKPQ